LIEENGEMLERFPIDKADFDGPVLVTGAGGCIGSWTLALLSRAGVPAIAYDLTDDRRRPRLLLSDDDLARIPWLTGDIADTAALADAVAAHRIRAIIHLAGLQVPFCKADPVGGAKVNVIGTLNVLEAARHHGLKRIAYASSIAALSFMPDAPWLDTLYGAYKLANEHTAQVYHQDWGVPSTGIRPGVVYGVARDQGLTSKTTVAILAAAAGRPYTIPFTGKVSALHAGEVASAFIRAVASERSEARVFDLNGRPTSVAAWLDLLRQIAPAAELSMDGAELPFPADLSDDPIQSYLGDYGPVPLEAGVRATYDSFKTLLAKGALSPDAVA
jgi:nucleoside-diphosphate-sugar epimerase